MLRFRLFGIPVVVRASFLVIAALIAYAWSSQPSQAVIWIAVIFFSILIHELGHALTARSYGSEVAIELNGVGGLTRWSVPAEDFGPGRRALVAAAGSAVGVVFGGLVWLVSQWAGPFTGVMDDLVSALIVVNLVWGLLNWLPVRALDGGHLLVSLLQKVAPRRGETIARVIFFVTAAAALVLAVANRLFILGALAAWMLWIEIADLWPQPESRLQMTFDEDEAADSEAEGGSATAELWVEPEVDSGEGGHPETGEVEPNVDRPGG